MMKKIIAGVGVMAFVVASATPAMASWHRPSRTSSDVTNIATVSNGSVANANTGLNGQVAGAEVDARHARVSDTAVAGVNLMETGSALAVSEASVEANNSDCGCVQHGDVTNVAFVNNNSVANANTGLNGQIAGAEVEVSDSYSRRGHHSQGGAEVDDTLVVAGNGLSTGNAQAESLSWVVVNSSLK